MDLETEYVALTDFESWPTNPKEHDVGSIVRSIEAHGFNDPVARDEETMRLVEGHGRIKALRRMKEAGKGAPENVRVVGDEWRVPTLTLDFESAEHVEAYMIAHNRTTERGGWDESTLAEVLSRQKAEGDVEKTAMEEETVEELLSRFVPDGEEGEAPDDFKEVDEDIETEYRCPKCGYEWSGSAQ